MIHKLPSGPVRIPPGPEAAWGKTHSVNCWVVGFQRPTLLGPNSVKYKLPSGPVAMAPSPALGVGTGISVTAPAVVILPIRFPPSSANHTAPSGPTQIALGADEAVSGNSTMGVVVLTVSELEPLTDPEVAEIVVCPTDALVARPVAVMGATATFEDTHVETLVTS